MHLRTILISLVAVSALAAAAPIAAQEAPAKRLANIAAVAVDEYSKGVDDRGRIFAQLEYDEAATFLADAQALTSRIDDGRASQLHALLDEMRTAVADRVAPAALTEIHARLIAVLGPDATLDYPRAPINLDEARALYAARCAACHGAAGAGNGHAAAGLNPPPTPLSDVELMADVTPALMYRIVTVGVQGTSMAAFADLTPAQRWAVVTYVTTLRARAEEAERGLALLSARCTRCADGALPEGHTFPWLAERHDRQVLAALAAGDAQLGMDSQPPLSAADARAILAGLRARPTVVAPPVRTPETVAEDVMRLLDESVARARVGELSLAGDLAFDAYVAFEPLEASVRTRDPGLVGLVERHFADFKGAVKANNLGAAGTARARIAVALPQVVHLAETPTRGWGAFSESLLIIVREGFEAILIIGAVVAFLLKTGNAGRVREVWYGVGAGLVASVLLAVGLRTALANAPASREVIEGVTMLLAVVVLFSVSYWLLSKVESARWQRFIQEKVGSALSSGNAHALTAVAFLAVFREGAETALFYQALLTRGPAVIPPVLAGMGVGALILAAIWIAFHRFGLRLPLRSFFATTGALLYLLAFIFMGKGLRELQEGNLLSITPLEHGPFVGALGIFPSVETLAGQGLLVVLALVALWRTLAVGAPPARAPAAVTFPVEVDAKTGS
ncbi:MAG: FTR1 family protein [Gemmatimonadaceae bacterium]